MTNDDFLIVDGLETVVLKRQQADGTFAAGIGVRATREPPNKRTVAGQMEAADVVFHLHGPDVGEDGVRPGDRISDYEEHDYTATGATLAGMLDTWRTPAVRTP